MKKIICLLITALMLFAAGCGIAKTEAEPSKKDSVKATPEPERIIRSEAEPTSELSNDDWTIETEKPIEIVSYENSGDYRIGLTSDGSCVICEYSGSEENIEIPEKLNEKTVIAIGEKAFENNNKITAVVIPGCVTEIGNEAFSVCSALSELSLNDGLRSIGEFAFLGCEKLTEVDIPDSVKTIKGSAFKGCGKLKKVTLPKNLTSIEHCTFAACGSLEKVELPSGIKSIGAWAFAWTPWEERLTDKNGDWLVVGQGASYIYKGSASEVVVPAEYKSYEFRANSDIKKITLSEGITSIPSYSCEALLGLDEIVIPSTIKTIGECAFRNTEVGELTFAEGLERIEKEAFQSSGTVILHLPDSVSYIDETAFDDCDITFSCSSGSYAEKFAQSHNIKMTGKSSNTDSTSDTATVDIEAAVEFIKNNESINGLKPGMNISAARKKLGEEESNMPIIINSTSGLSYFSKGYLITYKDSTEKISIVTVFPPCKSKTARGIGIGSTRAEVLEAYGDGINAELSNDEKIVFGDENTCLEFIFSGDTINLINLCYRAV